MIPLLKVVFKWYFIGDKGIAYDEDLSIEKRKNERRTVKIYRGK